MKIANGTWILVGDGRKALFLRNDGMPEMPNLHCIAMREQTNPATRDQGRDAPGRVAVAAGARRASVEPTDLHDLAERRFAHRLAADLNAAAHDGRYDHLIVVAPPRMLATLRDELSCEAKACLCAEIDKDLTRHTLADIETILMAAG
ncbi:host attachment protein [Siculibacillus lacustris]|uniref:Host attachment protein n=2 Tax=Siculibacillus lacustris TaxID=1549641 RepID=A0A4Q9VSJ0_9HYPH|nr:host attachment protein [Siculibacillus lacustris]